MPPALPAFLELWKTLKFRALPADEVESFLLRIDDLFRSLLDHAGHRLRAGNKAKQFAVQIEKIRVLRARYVRHMGLQLKVSLHPLLEQVNAGSEHFIGDRLTVANLANAFVVVGPFRHPHPPVQEVGLGIRGLQYRLEGRHYAWRQFRGIRLRQQAVTRAGHLEQHGWRGNELDRRAQFLGGGERVGFSVHE